MGINKLVRGKKSRLELLYPELYTCLQLQRPKEIKQGPVTVSFTEQGYLGIRQLAAKYNQNEAEFFEDVSLALAWALKDGIFSGVASSAELIGSLLFRCKEMRTWIFKCIALTGQIKWEIESLKGACRTTLLKSVGEDFIGESVADLGYNYTKRMSLNKISTDYLVRQIIKYLKEGSTKPNNIGYRRESQVEIPAECARYIKNALKREALENQGIEKLLFTGVGRNIVGYSISKFTDSLVSFYKHGVLPEGANILESAIKMRREGVKLFSEILNLHAQLQIFCEIVRRTRAGVIDATGSLNSAMEESLPNEHIKK